MTTVKNDQPGKLNALGNKVKQVPLAPDFSLLEAFPNRFPERLYLVSMVFPEFTSLCPVTGQPDFGVISLEYLPAKLCVESKSFKIYLFAYRSYQSFMETITNNILSDIINLLDPYWCRVKGLFAPRGATHIHVFCEQFKQGLNPEKEAEIRAYVNNWRMEINPHQCGL